MPRQPPFIIKSPRIQGSPLTGEALTRVELKQESELQDLLDRNPSILPLADIEPAAEGAVICIGREWQTPAGPIDNVLLTEGGILVLVETKLHRNPEARRQVISQILDYAAHARLWTYSELEKGALDWFKKRRLEATSLAEALGAGERELHDAVERNLEAGRMLLLVVGDGIREGARSLASMVATRPDMQFRLALVDLGIYSTPAGDWIVVPQVAVRTREIERAVVTVRYEETKPEIMIRSEEAEETQPDSLMTIEQLLADLRARGPEEAKAADELVQAFHAAGFLLEWGKGGVAVKMRYPLEQETLLSLLVINKYAQVWTYALWLEGQLKRVTDDAELSRRLGESWLDRFVKATGVTKGKGGASAKLASIGPRVKTLVDAASAMRAEVASACRQSENAGGR